MTRHDVEQLNTLDRTQAVLHVRRVAARGDHTGRNVRIGYRNADKHRVFIDAEIVGIACPDGFSRPLYVVTQRPGEMARLINLDDLLSLEAL